MWKLIRRRLSLWMRLLPILFFVTYLNITVFLFICGPWRWPVTDGTKLYTFLVLAHLALLMGYVSAALSAPGGWFSSLKLRSIIWVSLIANLVLLIPTSISRTGRVIPDIAGGLANPGAGYAASQIWRAERMAVVIEYVRIVMGPILSLQVPLIIYYWSALKSTVRVLAVSSILGSIAIYVSMGTNKGIVDLLLLAPWLILAGHFSGFLKLRRRQKVATIVIGVMFSFLFLWFFTTGQITRSGSGASSFYFHYLGIFADPDNFLVRYLPPQAKIGAIALVRYVTHGYYGLYLSLEKPFIPMFGVGNSMFLYRNAARLTGIAEIAEMPYPVRIEEDGWDAYKLWSTIYPWIASDVSFPGAIVVVFLIGRLFALSWLDALKGSNPFAIAAFAQFIIMLFYFPANNQVLQEGESLVSFYTILLLWLFTRRKYVWG